MTDKSRVGHRRFLPIDLACFASSDAVVVRADHAPKMFVHVMTVPRISRLSSPIQLRGRDAHASGAIIELCCCLAS